MSRFWEIVFCVPLLFRRHVGLSNLKHEPSRKLPLTARKTVFSHLNAIWLCTLGHVAAGLGGACFFFFFRYLPLRATTQRLLVSAPGWFDHRFCCNENAAAKFYPRNVPPRFQKVEIHAISRGGWSGRRGSSEIPDRLEFPDIWNTDFKFVLCLRSLTPPSSACFCW